MSDAPQPAEPTQQPASPQRFFLLAVAFEAGLAGLAVLIGWTDRLNPLASWRWSSADAGWAVVGTIPLLAAFWLMNRYPVGPLVALKRLVHEFVVPMFQGLRLWQLAAIAAAAGFGEEILFRGLLQGGLAGLFVRWLTAPGAMVVALVLASFVFGLMHMISATYAALCFLTGLYLGGLWLTSGNLLVPATVHGLYDFLALVFLLRSAKV